MKSSEVYVGLDFFDVFCEFLQFGYCTKLLHGFDLGENCAGLESSGFVFEGVDGDGLFSIGRSIAWMGRLVDVEIKLYTKKMVLTGVGLGFSKGVRVGTLIKAAGLRGVDWSQVDFVFDEQFLYGALIFKEGVVLHFYMDSERCGRYNLTVLESDFFYEKEMAKRKVCSAGALTLNGKRMCDFKLGVAGGKAFKNLGKAISAWQDSDPRPTRSDHRPGRCQHSPHA